MLAATLAAAGIAEATARFLARRGVVEFERFPTTPAPTFWDDINPAFGVWHLPNTSFRHVEPCYDVTYHSNSFGARDRERTLQSHSTRHIVLGDSFVEGWAVADGARFTDRLESATHEEYLNFGTAGNFGTIQEFLLYRTLASRFEHSDVLLFVVPYNDYADNDPGRGALGRYRPYLRRTDRGYEVYYPVAFENRLRSQPGVRLRWLNELSNALYLINIARTARIRRVIKERSDPPLPYGQFTDDDLAIMAESIRELAADAAPRPVRVFLAPTTDDLERFAAAGTFSITRPLANALRSSTNVRVVDLLPDFLSYQRAHNMAPADFYNACEGHWLPLGHAVAADAVLRHLDAGRP